jgi:hypothetical protein
MLTSPTFDGPSSAATSLSTESTRTPSETLANVTSVSIVPVTLPLSDGLSAAIARSTPLTWPFAFTRRAFFRIVVSNDIAGNCPANIDDWTIVPLALRSIVWRSEPWTVAAT